MKANENSFQLLAERRILLEKGNIKTAVKEGETSEKIGKEIQSILKLNKKT